MISVVCCSSSEESGDVVSCVSAYMSKITYMCVHVKLEKLVQHDISLGGWIRKGYVIALKT